MKPWIPCLSANLPVATEFQSIGDRIGWRVARLPITPRLINSSSVGMSPFSSRGVMCSQSAASQPIRRTLRLAETWVIRVEAIKRSKLRGLPLGEVALCATCPVRALVELWKLASLPYSASDCFEFRRRQARSPAAPRASPPSDSSEGPRPPARWPARIGSPASP